MFGFQGLNMRLAALDLLECTAGKVSPCDGWSFLQISGVMFVIMYSQNTRETFDRKKITTDDNIPRKAYWCNTIKLSVIILCLNLL